LAPDGGLYLPTHYLLISPKELAGFHYGEYPEIAYNILCKIMVMR